jgi:uncharacterized protein (TIGR02145 family)
MKIKNRIWFYQLFTVFVFIFSCNKEKDIVIVDCDCEPWIVYGSMDDQDGNTYKTISIGTQTWMAGNLKTTKYTDGTSIPLVIDETSWSALSTPACCWQNNDLTYKVTYGVLYNWYAVNTGKLCPAQWHVPSEVEWTTLFSYIGGSDVAGGKLKEKGTAHWLSPNTGATDEYGFNALPGGDRLSNPDGLFDNLHQMGCWWTTPTHNEDWNAYWQLYDNSSRVQKSVCQKKCGLSVRCVRDY